VALSLAFDVRDAGATREAHGRAEAELGPVAAVVANAGVTDRLADAAKLDPDAWRAELEVNLTGGFLSLQPALAGMRERGAGRIVAISSIAATDGLAGQVAYSAAKAGLLGMVRTLALEMAPSGVAVNAVLPGMIATEKVVAMPQEIHDRALARVPMRRYAQPEEVAAVVAFLCSDGPPTSPAPGSPSTAASASPTSPWAASVRRGTGARSPFERICRTKGERGSDMARCRDDR
jgi:NAD(P)-dependent dehydrogenase (short-subunit alcohol dehydrogenase family)